MKRSPFFATGKVVFLAILTSLALIISLIEQAMPLPIGVPGAKLGLSNLVILVTIAVYGAKEGMVVALLKSFLLLLVTGSVTSFWYSLLGAALSSAVMSLGVRYGQPLFSLIGISEMGAVAHNVGQLLVATVTLSNVMIFTYLPILTLVGLFSGFFVGLAANSLVPHLRRVSNSAMEGRLYERRTEFQSQDDASRGATDGENDALRSQGAVHGGAACDIDRDGESNPERP